MSTYVLLILILGFLNCSGLQNNLKIEVDTRIVGGNEVDIRSCPYQVSLQSYNQHFCGGALITPNTVLTAAHCFLGKSSFQMISYDVKIGDNTTKGQSHKISSVLCHPNYSNVTLDYDIALVKLSSNVTLSDRAKPIAISIKDNYTMGSYASVSGWGYIAENGTNVSPLLRMADVPLTSRLQCQKNYRSYIDITENMICAGFPKGGRDACQGDSGGPLVQNSRLIGVVSFGIGCAREGFPGVYTNVANLKSWIANNSHYNFTAAGGSNEYFSDARKNYGSFLLVVLIVFPLISLHAV